MLLLLACYAPTVPTQGAWIAPFADPDPGDTAANVGAAADTAPPTDTAPPEEAVPGLLLNEVVVKNRSTLQLDDDSLPDWVELYNPTAAPVALGRVSLSDASGWLWIGPRDQAIAPGEHRILYADGADGLFHAPFSLDASGEELTLAVDGTVTDRLSTGAMAADIAWARLPDGGTWAPTAWTTPGAPNGTAPSPTLDPTDDIYQIDTQHTIAITLSDASYASLVADRLTWVDGTVALDGVRYADVGVRLKAYVGSARTLDQKCGFKIDLGKYTGGRSWKGERRLTLNNMVQDYTYVHEHLAYTLWAAAGVPAPRTGYARVSVNGTDYGLYLMVEDIDSAFLSRWFSDTTGQLYEGAYGVDLMDGYENSFDYDQGPADNDRSDLTDVIDILDGPSDDDGIAALEEKVDLDEVLSNMAVEGVALHWDGYTTRNNYRLYHDPVTDKFQIIPWGADQTFTTEYYDPWSGYGNLFTFCLANRACAARYDARLLEVADIMDGLDLTTQADALHLWLLPDINTDPRREISMATHEYYYEYSLGIIRSYPDTVRAEVESR